MAQRYELIAFIVTTKLSGENIALEIEDDMLVLLLFYMNRLNDCIEGKINAQIVFSIGMKELRF